MSPALEECCLRTSANVSYAHAEEDVAVMTGMRVSRKTQQRLVQRHDFPSPIVETDTPVAEVQVDGGKVRLRTPLGEASVWRVRSPADLVGCAPYRSSYYPTDRFLGTHHAHKFLEVIRVGNTRRTNHQRPIPKTTPPTIRI